MIDKLQFSKDRFPSPGEACALVVGDEYKRTALLFDRIHVYCHPTGTIDDKTAAIPEEVTFGSGDAVHAAYDSWVENPRTTLALADKSIDVTNANRISDSSDDVSVQELANQFRETVKRAKEINAAATNDLLTYYLKTQNREMVSSYQKYGISVIPCYPKYVRFEDDFKPGPTTAYQAALANLPMVSEDDLSWKQILEFRSDKDALRKYRSLRTWLLAGLKVDSVDVAVNIIGKKIEDYEWSIKKHGLKTTTGVLNQVFGLKQIAVTAGVSGAAALAGSPIFSMIAAGAMSIARIALWLADRRIDFEDIERGDHSEIAIIYDARQKFAPKGYGR